MAASRDDTETGSPVGRVQVSAPGPGFAATGVVVAVLLALAIVKPWDWGGPGPRARASAVPAPTPTVAPRPTADLTPSGLAAGVCLGTGAWRVASLETWQLAGRNGVRRQEVRVWRALTPLPDATGPDDPAIPVVDVAAMEVDALGWCAPVVGPDAPAGPIVVTAFRLDRGGGDSLPNALRRIAPVNGETPFAALYQDATGDCPADLGSCSGRGRPASGTSWPAGWYVFRLDDQGGQRTLWFGVDVILLPRPSIGPPGPDPSLTPAARAAAAR